MPETYRTRHGLDWPAMWSDLFIDLTVAKKWKIMAADGVAPAADPGDCLERALAQLFPERLAMSPWTADVIHDFAKNDKIAFIGSASSGKSHAIGACVIAYWLTDPFDTAVVVGSSTLTDLRTRVWSPIVTLFSSLKSNVAGMPIPGKLVSNQYAIVNERDAAIAESQSVKASIQGRALDEGRVIGLHAPWVALVVDELNLLKDLDALAMTLANIRVGTLGCKIVTAANPEHWGHPNSVFYEPPPGSEVDADTGAWVSEMGYHVRHFDGLKSPVYLDPALKKTYPFLMSREDVEETRRECQGDDNHPRFWRMVRGFPMPAGRGVSTVLDPAVAAACMAKDPMPAPYRGHRRLLGRAAGADPAWSESGDDAVFAGLAVWEQDGRAYLDFSGGVRRLPVSAVSEDPVTKQLRDASLKCLAEDGGPPIRNLYIDSSGNQGLADDIDIYVGPGCGHINNSVRASDKPLRALDKRPAREHVFDRGAESWLVLAEFCKAGQVRGLPESALRALTMRRFAVRPKTGALVTPLRLEPKEAFIPRFKASPNEADACALAVLAAKETLGVMPFGGVPPPDPALMLPGAYADAPRAGVSVTAADRGEGGSGSDCESWEPD